MSQPWSLRCRPLGDGFPRWRSVSATSERAVAGAWGSAESGGDSWLGVFTSTDGGSRWSSTLLPGYPQDPLCHTGAPPALCGYQAGADAVVRAGTHGLFYYSGIVFDRGERAPSAVFVSRF